MIERKIQWMPTVSEHVRVDHMIEGGSVCAGSTITNWVVGVVQSQHVGLVRAVVRINVAARTALRVRWPIGNKRFFVVGQHVVATIPAEAVRLGAGIFRRSTQRWNRWIGRIVLMEPGDAGTVFTVKIHGEGWTLKAYGTVAGARELSKPWDAVNVVVDPQRVDLSIVDGKPRDQSVGSVLGQ